MTQFSLILAILFTSVLSYADGIADLKTFIAQSRALSANFTQQIIDYNGKKIQTSTGTLYIKRPGKFHWHYQTPYFSEMIGDGQTVWLYDPELQQVTIKKMRDAIDHSPAALLAGNNHFEKNYTVKNLPNRNKTVWLQAIPKSADNHFQEIRIGLQNKCIESLELVDQLGQTTTITFEEVVLNPSIPSSKFIFVSPPGVDIIRD